MEWTFEWDEEKAKENLKKHRVSFEEAKTVFSAPFLWTFPDPQNILILRNAISTAVILQKAAFWL